MTTICAKCGEGLVAPDWSEFVSEHLVVNLWSCTKCGCAFETEAFVSADAEILGDLAIRAFFPSLLVA